MEFWVRLALILGIFGAIELVDKYVNAFNWPWFLSLAVAVIVAFIDKITVVIIDLGD